MSSSRVFKADTSFVPITLISEEILPPREEAGVPEEPATFRSVEEDEQTQVVEEPSPEPQPTPPPAQQPQVDLQAIRDEAYQQGAADTLQELGARLHTAMEALAQGCDQLHELHRTLQEQSRGNLINTVMALARKIVQRELHTDRETVVSILEAALEHTLDSSECVITVHPDDLATVQAREPELLERIRSLEHIVFKADPDMEYGGCRVESGTYLVDATIEGQLEAARNFLEHHLRADGGDLQDPPADSG